MSRNWKGVETVLKIVTLIWLLVLFLNYAKPLHTLDFVIFSIKHELVCVWRGAESMAECLSLY